ncbi:TP53-regulating kinase-like [Centruroides sculpturatus]|uniref:TP53-regulating kinase-like n=1 Tax=Centruroides sculpturatus TaxID=218467 RepID=UPI000C6E75CF|nr:TP53-regulating kinase-like [Centruroides sculpturatus]
MEMKSKVLLKQGAEAKVYKCTFLGKESILKERFKKTYRFEKLDEMLTKERMKAELRSLLRCRQAGIHCPAVYFVNMPESYVVMEFIPNITVRQFIQQCQTSNDQNAELMNLVEKIGKDIAKMHSNDLIHGDLTTSNMLIYNNLQSEVHFKEDSKIYFIDFGLSYVMKNPEDKGVDLYVLERAFLSTHPNTENLFQHLLKSYRNSYKSAVEVLKKLDEIRLRGRKRTMVG